MRHTHNRSQRFGGHTNHARYCSCGRSVYGNGGKRHFELEDHHRIGFDEWWQKFGKKIADDSWRDGGGR